MTAGESHDGQRWGGRGTLAVLLRALAVVGPAVAAWLACTALRQLLPAPVGTVGRLTIGALLLVVGVAVAFGVTRLTARLAPLAWLLRIDTAFPDAAPSRFELAQRANRTKDLVTLARSPETPTHQRTAAERILVLAAAIAAHDRRTRGHSERVRAYTRVVGQAMGLRGTQLDKLAWAGLLHDVGKLVVEPEVLTKPGRLDVHEHRQIQQHPVAGFRMAEPLVPWLGDWGKAFLHHHERFDGTGYPFGLAGDDISLGGRIVAVADAFEAMTARRSYNTPRTLESARQELADSAGTHFDPAIVRAFLAVPVHRLARIALPSAGLSASGVAAGLLDAAAPLRTIGQAFGRVGAAGMLAGAGAVAVVAGAGPVVEVDEVVGAAPATTTLTVAGGEVTAVPEGPIAAAAQTLIETVSRPDATPDRTPTPVAQPTPTPTPTPSDTPTSLPSQPPPTTPPTTTPVPQPTSTPAPEPSGGPLGPIVQALPEPVADPVTQVQGALESTVESTVESVQEVLPPPVASVVPTVADLVETVVETVEQVVDTVLPEPVPQPLPPPAPPAPPPPPAGPVPDVAEDVGDVVGDVVDEVGDVVDGVVGGLLGGG